MKIKERNCFEHMMMAMRYSIDGFKVLIRETAIKQELILGVINFLLLMVFRVEIVVALIICLEYVILLVVEMLNTAIEKVVDLCSPEWNALAKQAKDVASAAVCTMIVALFASWLLALLKVLGD